MKCSSLLKSKLYNNYKLTKDLIFFNGTEMSNINYVEKQQCWLYNKKEDILYPLVADAVAVFCTLADIEDKTLEYIIKHTGYWNLEVPYRFWVYKTSNPDRLSVEWTVQLDGLYGGMDDSGFGDSSDIEIIIHGEIDSHAKVVTKFTLYEP